LNGGLRRAAALQDFRDNFGGLARIRWWSSLRRFANRQFLRVHTMSDPIRSTVCPDAATLRALLDATLPEDQLATVQAHVDQCRSCEAALRAMTAGGESWIGMAEKLKGESGSDPKLAAAMERLKTDDGSGGDANEPVDPQRTLDFLSPSDDPKLLGRLGQHEVLEVIGWGGMGVVLKAYDPSLHRVVAVKVLSSHLAHHAVARKRFIREAQAAAAVCHDNVVTIHAIDEDGVASPNRHVTRSVSEGESSTGLGRVALPTTEVAGNQPVSGRGASPLARASGYLPKIVMQYVAGGSLQERIDSEGPLELKEILRIAMQTAAGLAAAHAQGVVHRDVKPANILLENGVQRVKLTDFGLARVMDDASLTLSGVIAGTPQYMAPEQAWGRDVDARADLFSLGAVMYAMCSGHSPFRARTTMAVLKRVCEDAPRPLRAINPDVPEWLVAIIEKLLAKNPDDRFQSATEVSELLAKWLAHVQQPTVVPAPEIIVSDAFEAARNHPRTKGWVTDPRSASAEALLAMNELQHRPQELRDRLQLAMKLLVLCCALAIPMALVIGASLPAPGSWSPAESFRYFAGAVAVISVALAVVIAVNRWVFAADSSGKVRQSPESDHRSPESGRGSNQMGDVWSNPSAGSGDPRTTRSPIRAGTLSAIWVLPILAILAVLHFFVVVYARTQWQSPSLVAEPIAALLVIQTVMAIGQFFAFRWAWNTRRRHALIGAISVHLAIFAESLFLNGMTRNTADDIVMLLRAGLIFQFGLAVASLIALLVRQVTISTAESSDTQSGAGLGKLAQPLSPEGGTTSATISPLSPKIIVVALVVTSVVLATLSIAVIETNPRNLGGFLEFSLVQLAVSFAMAASFRAAWNTSRWVTWIAVLLFLPFVGSLFGMHVSYQNTSGAAQLVGSLQILSALVYEFSLLFVRPLFVSGGVPQTTIRPVFWRWTAMVAVVVPLVVLPLLYFARMSATFVPVHRDPPGASHVYSGGKEATELVVPLHQQPPPSAKLLSNLPSIEDGLLERSFPALSGVSSDSGESKIELGLVDLDQSSASMAKKTSTKSASSRAELPKALLGRWVVLTLQGDDPPITMASAGGMGGAGMTFPSTPASPVTPVRMDQLRSLEFRNQSLFWNDSEQAKLRVLVRKDHVLDLSTTGGEFVRHGIFTVEGDRLLICWGPSNQPLPRGFQPSGNEQLLVCRREWSRPSERIGDDADAVQKFGKDSKLPRAEMPFSSREAAELQQAWAEKTGSSLEVTNSIGMKLRVIPPGTFGDPVATLAESADSGGAAGFGGMTGGSTGSPRSGERGYGAAVKGPILVGAHEVTVAQFRQFVEDSKYVTEFERLAADVARYEKNDPKQPTWRTPDIEQNSEQHPVVNVTFDDALAFCHWLSLKEKKPYRLLTRREWEFCARAGSWLPVTLGPGKLAYRSQFFTTTAPVGSYSANSFGLHDFIGNAAEWAWQDDILADDPRRNPGRNQVIHSTDPGVFCGGDFRQHINRSQPGEWLHPESTTTTPMIGFRVACDLTAESLVSHQAGWPPIHQLFATQEIVRLRHLPPLAPADDPNAKADESKPREELRHVVWLELMTDPGALPYFVEWQDFEVQRRTVREGELSEDAPLRATLLRQMLLSDEHWKPVPLDEALRLLDQTDFSPDVIPPELTDPVITMPIPKVVEGNWFPNQHRWTKPGLGGAFPIRESDATLPEFQRPRLLRFLDFHAPNGEHFYRVRLKYRIPHLTPETVHTTEWFADDEPVTIDVDRLGGRKPLENLPTIELKPIPTVNPTTAPPTPPTSPKLRRWRKEPVE
jgi:serine/threonine-protein kinase